ncbi:MAG: hypothetical protein QOG01_1031 [Pseudonocardiales bacterium]|jgi:hypothetical protein|nr:hypothetical protein [Pseudonocardiales bacterium]
MSAVVTLAAPTDAGAQLRRPALAYARILAPSLAALVNAAAFFVVRPNVGDLQAALARQLAAASGVGLGYWFQWFGGGTTPGHYSVLSPYLTSWIGAPLTGALATVLITPLAYRAFADTRFRTTATWLATITSGLSLWSGRIPFALGCAAAILAFIGVRERRIVIALLGAVASALFSPVTGAFIVFGLAAFFVVDRGYRKLTAVVIGSCGAALLFVAAFFGTPGPQGYTLVASLTVSASALVMVRAAPAPAVRVVLWCTTFASPLLAIFPNGMGSNFTRLPWICLPAVVVATARARRLVAVLTTLPALALCADATIVDLRLSSQPAAARAYYNPLISDLQKQPGIANYRVEVVQDTHIHTAAYVLISHVALAGGYETQEANALNSVLTSKKGLDATSYKVWLDNNAVGYVAFDKSANDQDSAEYRLVAAGNLPYLTRVSEGSHWTLYRVRYPTPIVPAPERLLSATQSSLRIDVPCACTFHVRVRYSKFLGASTEEATPTSAVIADDGTGWTIVSTPAPGVYVLTGKLSQPFGQ